MGSLAGYKKGGKGGAMVVSTHLSSEQWHCCPCKQKQEREREMLEHGMVDHYYG